MEQGLVSNRCMVAGTQHTLFWALKSFSLVSFFLEMRQLYNWNHGLLFLRVTRYIMNGNTLCHDQGIQNHDNPYCQNQTCNLCAVLSANIIHIWARYLKMYTETFCQFNQFIIFF